MLEEVPNKRFKVLDPFTTQEIRLRQADMHPVSVLQSQHRKHINPNPSIRVQPAIPYRFVVNDGSNFSGASQLPDSPLNFWALIGTGLPRFHERPRSKINAKGFPYLPIPNLEAGWMRRREWIMGCVLELFVTRKMFNESLCRREGSSGSDEWFMQYMSMGDRQVSASGVEFFSCPFQSVAVTFRDWYHN